MRSTSFSLLFIQGLNEEACGRCSKADVLKPSGDLNQVRIEGQ